jgi:ribose transport system substrate-binding protein
MRYLRFICLLAAVLLAVALLACGDSDDDDGGAQDVAVKASEETGRMLGPNGEESTPAEEIELTDAELDEIQAGDYTAAIAWHENTSELSRAATKGFKDRLEELGIELVAVTDAGFDPVKQRNDIESILARRPDGLVSIPIDPKTSAPAFREALERDVKLSFISNIPKGFEHRTDYVAIGSSDQIDTGENTAKLMGEALGGKGKVGVIFHDADFFITNQRDAGFRSALKKSYPDIEIVAEEGFEDPAKVEEVAAAMITRNPDLDGIYTTWAEPAEGVLAALREAGRDHVKLVTVDLSNTLAVDMARNGNTAGIASDKIVEDGALQADLLAYGFLGKEAPAFVVTPGLAVNRDNLLESWEIAYGEEAPEEVQQALAEEG